MISALRPLAAGNAVRLFLTPPPGALSWRVLRRAGASAAIPDPSDAGAVVVTDASDEETMLDATGLENDQPYTWRAFYRMPGDVWVASVAASATPAATYQGEGPDPQGIVRERLDLGLRVEVARGALQPNTGRIQVLTAPHAGAEAIDFPAVSVHQDSADPADRALGEAIGTPAGIGDAFVGFEGWLQQTRLTISAVSTNSDERVALRLALTRILHANLPVFDAAGLSTVAWAWRDQEALLENGTSLYFADATFTCVAPAGVSSSDIQVVDANAFAFPYHMEPPNGL